MTDRLFGTIWCIICLIISGGPVLHGGSPRLIVLIPAITLALCVLLCPALLAPFNRLWTAFGRRMHAIVSFVALFLIYFLVMTPGGLLMKACGRRRIATGFEPAKASYWQTREAPGTDFTRPY